ncbi:hypothetical protein MGYG_04111 [Nannizzia gypsea CBS 118893]|uniref:Get5 N-terminal domain-containing protein n=1 Tax=Arthroderma gypseum (strain ATCC MYA-4604 / CBS 118893) TaxID=535722 RepID=E4UUZ0_ARTGP|nr:hypothetical protein MGYG_04111 [Nannizzia gypsea CBS 118893]EFR01107.1 hypothetical protein MGYG_04111 [Nannizzia gypsea CBS 118893]
MAEVSFAKSFLASLDSKPIKVPADTVYDPQTFAPRFPIILPRLTDPPHPPMPKKVKTTAPPGSSKGITVHLKSARNPVLDIKLPNVALATATVQELKDAVHQRIRPSNATDPDQRVPLDKIKLLWKRKPVQGTSIADILADESDIIRGNSPAEFSVMVLGGASIIPEEELKAAAAATTKAARPLFESDPQEDTEMKDPGSEEVQETPQSDASLRSEFKDLYDADTFWEDMRIFIQERMPNPDNAPAMVSIFKAGLKDYLK